MRTRWPHRRCAVRRSRPAPTRWPRSRARVWDSSRRSPTGRAAELAGEDDLLLVAARQRSGRPRPGVRARMSKGAMSRSASVRDRPYDGDTPNGVYARSATTGRTRFSSTVSEADESGRGGGPTGRGRSPQLVRRDRPTSRPSTRSVPRSSRRTPASASVSSTCPLPSMPATPSTSPPRTSKLTSCTAIAAAVAHDRESRLEQRRRPRRLARAAGDDRPSRRARRSSARPDASGRVGAQGAWPRCRPRRRTRHAVGDAQDLLELVTDEEDADALRRQVAQDAGQLQRLLRRKQGGRLVKDEDRRLSNERLEQLGPLLLADASGPRRATFEVDLQVVAFVPAAGRCPRRRRPRPSDRRPRSARTSVLRRPSGSGSARSAAGRSRPRGRARPAGCRMAAPRDRDEHAPGVGSMQAEDDAHEVRLAGPVLAEDRVDLAGAAGRW